MTRTEMLAIIREQVDIQLDHLREQIEKLRHTADIVTVAVAPIPAKRLPSKNDD